MTIDERVTAFMEARGFKRISPDDWQKGDVLLCTVQARFMYHLVRTTALEARKEALEEADRAFTHERDPQQWAEDQVAELDKLIAETQ